MQALGGCIDKNLVLARSRRARVFIVFARATKDLNVICVVWRGFEPKVCHGLRKFPLLPIFQHILTIVTFMDKVYSDVLRNVHPLKRRDCYSTYRL